MTNRVFRNSRQLFKQTMFKKTVHFFKYHNAAVFIVAAVFLLGSAVFASQDIQSAIGAKKERIEGFDNSLLLQADLENFNMEFKIEKVEEEGAYYFVSFSFLDLAKEKEGWQYKLKRKILKFKEKNNLAMEKITGEELAEIRQARIKFLKSEQEKAKVAGERGRTEIAEYSGLIGKTLDAVSKIFPGFEPGQKKELPLAASLANFKELAAATEEFDLNHNPAGSEIDLTEVYANYLIETGSVDGNGTTTQAAEEEVADSNSAQIEDSADGDSAAEENASSSDSTEPEVEIIDLSEIGLEEPASESPAQENQAPGEAAREPAIQEITPPAQDAPPAEIQE